MTELLKNPLGSKQILLAANEARDAKDYPKAVRLYEEYLTDNPTNADIQIQCGHMQSANGNLAGAGRHYRAAEVIMPDDADLQVLIGHYHQTAGDLDAAILAYRRALQADPANADAKSQLEVILETSRAATSPLAPGIVPAPLAAPAVIMKVALLELPLVGDRGPMPPAESFAEQLYLSTHTDVLPDGAPNRGMRHWVESGFYEDVTGQRGRIPNYVENVYLRSNADVAQLIGSGTIQSSGYEHFLRYGVAEGRNWSGSLWEEREKRILAEALTTRSSTEDLPNDVALPLISVIVPVYDPPLKALLECIESVRTQSYQHWELCLADDGSHQPETVEALVMAERSDARIRVVFAARNGGISAASNAALAVSSGEFCALLDNDDILAPDALLHIAKAFLSGPDVDLVYTDEAKLSEDGRPFALNPKPGWSPELLLSTMYIGHLTAYRRSVIDQAGGFRTFFDGTQDYDLALRAAELVRNVVHVPLPLYFWRLSPASTAGSIGVKPKALALQRQALENALIRRKHRGRVTPGHSLGHWTVMLDVPEDKPLVSIVIPTAGRLGVVGGTTIDLLLTCIHSIDAIETYPNYEFVVVHNDDLRPETVAGLAAFRNVRLVAYKSTAFNLSDKINLGVQSAHGAFVLLLNDDMQAESRDIIQSMMGRMFEGVGIVGGRLLYANGLLQHAGIVWTAEGPTHAMIGEHRLTAGPAERLRIMHNCFGVSGACMFFRREIFLENGGFSPQLPTNYNDVDLCLKIRSAGLRIVFNPDVTMYHFESLSKIGTHFWELQRLLLGYPGIVDPFWNSTFSQSSPFFELKNPDTKAPPSYRAWMMRRIASRRGMLTTSATIRFSLFMSVYETSRSQLAELEGTILNQTYSNWEWVIVDNGSSRPETLAWLEHIQSNPSVRFVRLETNQGIMGGYGAAFRASTGDYVVPVDSDDFLTLDCLQVLATGLEKAGYPEAAYSDEDKANEEGTTHSPFLKPDWDPVLFTNVCFVCHVCALKRETAIEIGAYMDDGAAFCHDWDSFLRLQRAGARIVHIPEIVYSWRIHAGSTASIATSTKPQTITSQLHVLKQHLRLTGMDRDFEVVHNEMFNHDGIWRIKPVAASPLKSAILLIAGPDVDMMLLLLLELARDVQPDVPVVIVDAAAAHASMLASLPPELKILLGLSTVSPVGETLTLATALSLCGDQGRDKVAVLDASISAISRDWLREGLGMFAATDHVAAVGGQVLLPDGRVAWRGGFRGFGGAAGSPEYGRAQSDSGYHGFGWCQRLCDSVPPVCFFARTDQLQAAAAALGDRPLSLRELAGQVAAAAWRANERIIYTPIVQVTLSRELPLDPIVPRGEGQPPEPVQHFYHAALSTALDSAYGLL